MPHLRYLVSCPCGNTLAVTAEQAGATLTCRACNNPVDVPSLRELRQLPIQSDEEPSALRAKPVLNAKTVVILAVALLISVVLLRFTVLRPAPRQSQPALGAQKPSEPAKDRAVPASQEKMASSDVSSPPRSAISPASVPERAAEARAVEGQALPSLDYLEAVDLEAVTNAQLPVGVVLMQLGGMVAQQVPERSQAVQQVAQGVRIHQLRQQLRLSDERLGDQRRVRLAARFLRSRVREQQGIGAEVQQAREHLSRLTEINELLEVPDQVRDVAVENFRQRVREERERTAQQVQASRLSERNRKELQKISDRLAEIESLPSDQLVDAYCRWMFQQQWVEEASRLIQRHYAHLQFHFGVPLETARELLADEEQFHQWLEADRPRAIRRELERIAAMSDRLLKGELSRSEEDQLTQLCSQWLVTPAEAGRLLEKSDADLAAEIDRRTAEQIRRRVAQWLSMRQSQPERANQFLEPLTRDSQLPQDVQALEEFANQPEAAVLAHYRSLLPDRWRRELQRLVELAETVADPNRLREAAEERAGQQFRAYVQQDIQRAERLLQQELPHVLRAAVAKDIDQLKVLLAHGDRELLAHSAEAVQSRLLYGMAAALIDEAAILADLYQVDAQEAARLVNDAPEEELEQAARKAAVKRIRRELTVLARRTGQGPLGRSVGQRATSPRGMAGSGAGQARRQAVEEKYGVSASEARRLMQDSDEGLWRWHLNRLSEVTDWSDEQVIERWSHLLPSEPEGEMALPLEELGQNEREELMAAIQAAEKSREVSVIERLAPPSIPSAASPSSQQRALRAALQPHLQPISQYLSQAVADPQLRDELSGYQDIVDLFAARESVPAWVGLLQSGLLRALWQPAGDAQTADLVVFLPVSPKELTASNAAEQAYRNWYGVLRFVVNWFREDRGIDRVRLRVFAYLNEYAICTLWLAAESWETELVETPPPEGKATLDLASWREFLRQSRLQGLQILDGETRPQLALVGELLRSEEPLDSDLESERVGPLRLLGRPVELQDLAVAYRAIFYGGDNQPYQSLDPSASPAVANANFGGYLEDTALGHALLEADLTFKFLASGLDPQSSESLDRREEFRRILRRRGFPDFQPVYDEFARRSDQGLGEALQETRFWLSMRGQGSDEQHRFEWLVSPVAVQVTNPFFVAEARKLQGIRELPEENLPPWVRQAIDHLNQYRVAYEEFSPVLEEVRSVGILLALCQWMKDQQVNRVFDLDALLAEPVDVVPTPRQRLRGVYANVLDGEGHVRSYNCSEIMRPLRSRSLETVLSPAFEGLAQVTAASLALARAWESEDPAVSTAYESISDRGLQAMRRLDRLPQSEVQRFMRQIRVDLSTVPQRQWIVGCAWVTTGGIDLKLPRPRYRSPHFLGKHSAQGRWRTSVDLPRRPVLHQTGDRVQRSPERPMEGKTTPMPTESSAVTAGSVLREPSIPSNAKAHQAAPEKPRELQVRRRGNRARLERVPRREKAGDSNQPISE